MYFVLYVKLKVQNLDSKLFTQPNHYFTNSLKLFRNGYKASVFN